MAVKKLGVKLTKKVGNTGVYQDKKKIGVSVSKGNKVVKHLPGNYIGNQPVILRQNPIATPGNPIVAYTPTSGNNAYQQQQQIGQGLHQSYLDQKTPDMNDAIGGIANFFKILSDPSTPKYALGYLVAGIVILIGLYGVVIGGQKNIIQSAISKTSGFKKKGK